MTQHREFSRGTHWLPDRGKLYRFSDHGVVVIRPWPNPQAWVKRGAGPWRSARPCVDVGMASGAQTSLSAPVRNWAAEVAAWSQIPQPIRRATVQAHLNDDQWSALMMLARCQGALELAQSVPFLSAMLSISHTLRPVPVQRPLRSIRALLKTPDGWHRWRKIAGWLGLDESKAFVRMLRRVQLEPAIWWRRQDLDALLTAWQHPHGRKLLCHTPHITQSVAELLGAALERHALSVVTHPLMQEVATSGRTLMAAPMLSHTLMFWRFMSDRPLPPPVRSVARLEAYRLQATEAIHAHFRQRVHDDDGAGLPTPPLSAVSGIRPLSCPDDLIQEGTDLRHCIGDGRWARQARRFLGYGYAVQAAGHRASVWIRRDRARPCGFEIDQIRGQANGAPAQEIVRSVEDWLARHDAWARYRQGETSRPSGDELGGPEDEGWFDTLSEDCAEELGLYPDEIPF